MYYGVLRAALSCDGIKPDLSPRTSDKNGLGKKKTSEGKTERSKNNLKQKEEECRITMPSSSLVLILLTVSLDGVDYF